MKNNLIRKNGMQFLDTDQYLCPAKSSRHDQWLLCEQFIEMCEG